jgi:hypothetical protein
MLRPHVVRSRVGVWCDRQLCDRRWCRWTIDRKSIAHDRGQDVDVVASELLAQVLLADNQGARELEMLLARFESRYQMDSRSFYQKFQAGTIGDSADFFEWNA